MPSAFDSGKISPALLASLDGLLDAEWLYALFCRIAETPGPSQTVAYSRGAAIANLARQEMSGGAAGIAADLVGTGNTAIRFAATPRIVFVAHADEISYLVGDAVLLPDPAPGDPAALPLIPFCNHNAQMEWPGSAWHYDMDQTVLIQTATGLIRTGPDGSGGWRAWFSVADGRVEPGDRIIYDAATQPVTDDLLRGKVDNGLGVTALLAGAIALHRLGLHPPVWFLFTDEEEGPPQTNANFARGMRRLLHAMDFPGETLFVEVDAHEIPHGQRPRPQARFAEQARLCHGVVTPPDLYVPFRRFAGELVDAGVHVSENRGYVSRSDSVALMERYRNVLLWGYDAHDTHYRHGWPTASFAALKALAQLTVCTALAVES